MNTVEFLSHLRRLDINVFVDGDRLRCNAPERILTPELRAELSQRKAEIVSFLKKANQSVSYIAPPLVPVSRDRNLLLSFAQQRLWFLDQLVPNNPFYNMPAAVRLTGDVNLAALEKAFNEIVRRHEALRTNFAVIEGQPVQKIASDLSISIPRIDLRSIPEIEREKEAQQLIVQEAERPFNLSTDPPLRIMLVQLGETEYLLMLNMHHIVSDGWSIGVLIQELGVIYTALVREKPSPLPELSIQYADFADWQRQWLQGEVLETQLSYWRKQLDGISMLNLPTDRPRPAVQSYQGRRQLLQLPKKLSDDLVALSQREGVTLFMTLLAAFKILLYRYTQQEDIAVGSPIANRNRVEIESLIGFFVNSLVLRTDLSKNPTFRELLGRVKEVALGAYAHQDLPFEKLVEELHPDRQLNQNPLFQVAFALQNAPMEALELPGLTLSPQQLDAGTARFDLEFHLWERSPNNQLWVDSTGGISGFVIYSADLFEEATINRAIAHFQTLLEAIVANPDRRIAELPILSEAERHQLLVQWNQTQANYPKNLCVHELVEIQADRNREAIALEWGDDRLTYGELNIRSNKLAHYLTKLGVGAEVVVALCIERSLDAIVAMLGILKAGGAYLPLDPTSPRDRLNLMLEDAKVPILLTHQQWQEHLGVGNYQVVCLDKDWEIIDRESLDNPSKTVTTDNLAYVIYTSGSTGQPKGVEIEQGSLLNLIFWHQKEFKISPGDRATQVAGIAFDACGWEIWPYLAAGASVSFPNDEIRRSSEQLQDWLVSQAITISFLPTPLAEKILQLNWPENAALRILLTGGEKLHQYPLESHRFKVVNNYGPTENTVVTTSGFVCDRSHTAPTIGRPIANTQVYVLDKHLQPVPAEIPGELYISGDGLARGYRSHPELTAERFILNPFIASTNESDRVSTLYKTGDLVRYRSDGNLEFLGRLDEQVKIRGFRIELGEVEAVLTQHPAVQRTVVMTADNEQKEKRLVAYLAINSDSNPVSEELEKMQLQEEQVLQWQLLYNETYKQPAADSDPTFNIVGWNSSYTDRPIPVEQMREWVENQATEILALQPNRVLEIGCGTGLLLFRIAPHCTEYCGTDFSRASLNYIRQHLSDRGLNQVTLLEKMATDFNGVEPGAFDAIILNSVVQYFPSIDYLLQVLEKAVKVTAPGGFIFIGDVRSLPLLEAFHTSVQLERSEPSLTREQLRQRVQMQVFQETELVIDPAFFHVLKQHFSQISGVQIQLMRGRGHNELTQFRYNAILQIGSEADCQNSFNLGRQGEEKWLNWNFQEENITPAKVSHQLIEKKPEFVKIFNVPNARIMAAVKAAEWLSNDEEFKTVNQLQKVLQKIDNLGVDPEDWYALNVPYAVNISWSDSGSEGFYDVMFVREDATVSRPQESSDRLRPWRSYANNPLQAKAARKLVPQLQAYLTKKLPDYMVPQAFVVLESFPLTPNGKVDRHALPTPDPIQLELAGGYAAPRTPIEEVLVKIWTEVLGLKRVGIRDNFFELGGHSLLATQLVSRVRDAFGIELPLRSVFEARTIAELSKLVESFKKKNSTSKAPALVPISRESRRMKLSSLNKENK